MGCMNLFFYLSLSRIPLGVAVAIEFTGPLAVAVATSRRAIDFAWIALAAIGLIELSPLAPQSNPVDLKGVGLALLAGVFWALYIIFGQRAGEAHGGQSTALGMGVAAMAIVPIGIVHAGSALFSPMLLPLACAFGVLMSGDPALGALSGFFLLGEKLSLMQWSSIGCIILASAGSAATARHASAGTGLIGS
jgi:inner membrane transporter RhtA